MSIKMATQDKNQKLDINPDILNPLIKMEDKIIKSEIIDPTTGKPYDGIILEGIAASFNNGANRNNREYDEENYVHHVEELRKTIHSKKGLYGELEHPEGYSINYNNVCAKILDLWYDKNLKTVFIRILLLNTPKGLIAQEIVKSGGMLSVSARAAGYEETMANGVKKALITLLVTYDIVCHPGFGDANVDFIKLNESIMSFENSFKKGEKIAMPKEMMTSLNESYKGFNEKMFEDASGLSESYHKYMGFMNNMIAQIHKLCESDESQQKQDAKTLQDSDPIGQQAVEDELKKATEKTVQQADEEQKKLNEEEERQHLDNAKNSYFSQVRKAINNERLRNKFDKQGSALYDGSAGFLKGNHELHVQGLKDENGYVTSTQEMESNEGHNSTMSITAFDALGAAEIV